MIPLPNKIYKKVKFLIGKKKNIDDKPFPYLDKLVINYLSDLSSNLLSRNDLRNFPDVSTFAFWCRKSNLKKIVINNSLDELRVGLGLIYHNSPSNVPINFAYSLAFGLLSGNVSVVRVSSKYSESRLVIINELVKLLKKTKYKKIKNLIHLVQFEYDDEVNEFWISNADGKLIWGGDKTVLKMRSFKTKPRSREIVFPDRFSMCLINANKVLTTNDNNIKKLCENLYNDIYLLNQMACSSPQLFVWIGSNNIIKKSKNKIWGQLINIANRKNNIEPIEFMNKYVDICKTIISNKNIKKINIKNNLLYNVELKSTENHNKKLRGYYGTLNEISFNSISNLLPIIDEKCQTLTYFGYKKDYLKKFIVKNRLRGIDRIVPVGQSVDMDIVWDGYDILNQLSRNIVIK